MSERSKGQQDAAEWFDEIGNETIEAKSALFLTEPEWEALAHMARLYLEVYEDEDGPAVRASRRLAARILEAS